MKEYTIKEISDLENISQKIIRREIAKKNIQVKVNNNKYLISKKEYLKWKKNFRSKNIEQSRESIKFKESNVEYIDIKKDMQKDGWNTNYKNGYNFIDLFSGAGGLSCGLVMAGFNPIATVEINEFATKTYEYNFIERKGFKEFVCSRDIKNIDVKKELYKKVENVEIDLIAGGFPCQGFSMSGNRIVEDERNSLYLDMVEIVKKIKPKCVVMENVEGIMSMLNGEIVKKIIKDYKKIGYRINVKTLNAADYGVPQLRKRVIFIANRINQINKYPKPIFTSKNYKTLGESIEKYIDMPENKSINHIITKHTDEMAQKLLQVEEGKSLYSNYSDSWKKSPWNKPSCTIKENHGGVNIHPKLARVLTPRELAELQSFPEDFIFKGAKKWQLVQIGNAVPPLLGKAIGVCVKNILNNHNLKNKNIK